MLITGYSYVLTLIVVKMSTCGEGVSDVAHHVDMELADVHVQDTVEAQGCGQGEDHLGRPDGSGWCRWDIVIAR